MPLEVHDDFWCAIFCPYKASGGRVAKAKDETNILVFDMGGGTFDVSILAIQDTVFEVYGAGRWLIKSGS